MMKRSIPVVLVGLLSVGVAACTGAVTGAGASGSGNAPGGTGTGNTTGGSGSTSGGTGSTSGGGTGGAGGTNIMPGPVTTPPMAFEATSAQTAVRKVKNLLTGLPATDDDVSLVTAMGAAGLQTLIDTWQTDPAFQPLFHDKMIFLFRNMFQQTSFSPLDDFKPQLLQNGGFDFGPFGVGAVGDDSFARLVQNLQDSFALTAWQLVANGQPFSNVLTTQQYMMTTALKSLYIQIEMPNDQPYAFTGQNTTKLAWKVDMSGTAIPLEDTLNPSSPNYMVFDDEAPVMKAGFGLTPTCQGTAGLVNPFSGYAMLFQRLLGFTPRYPFAASPQCWEHASKPYFTTSDVSDWTMVNVHALASGESYIQPYDLPTLRKTTDIGVKLPRVGFFTTPAYLALWNTNDSNQHRVTANQTLLVALGQSFTSDAAITPLSAVGLDPAHSVAGSECLGCHKSLDPLRNFWANQFDYNDRNDFPAQASFTGAAKNPRPTTTGGLLAFGSVNAMGASMLDLGPLILQVTDTSDASQNINRFAIAVTQKLCYFANSTGCLETDAEFRRIAHDFEASNFNFPSLVKELFSSPLVTGASTTDTFSNGGVEVSISRRDQLCGALANRLGKDVCSLAVPLPSTTQAATVRIATSVPGDAFSRGSEIPLTASDPTLFFRAATEMLCENVATQVVDATSGSVYASTDSTNAITSMVQNIMGYPPSDEHYTQAVQILQEHYTAVVAAKGTATNALRSTFTLACESPTSLSFGL
jgi:hypothetical protein